LKIGLIVDFGALKPGFGESPPSCPPRCNSFIRDGFVEGEDRDCCTPSSALAPSWCEAGDDPAGNKRRALIGGAQAESEGELESIGARVIW